MSKLLTKVQAWIYFAFMLAIAAWERLGWIAPAAVLGVLGFIVAVVVVWWVQRSRRSAWRQAGEVGGLALATSEALQRSRCPRSKVTTNRGWIEVEIPGGWEGRGSQAVFSGMVAEGINTTAATIRLAEEKGIEMPITEELYHIVYQNKDVRASLEDITTRVYKEEEA